MKVINFGSLNIDLVFRVQAIARPGETISSYSCKKYPGGKGLNQSIALARAGVKVCHGGIIGNDGIFLRDLLQKEDVDCSLLEIAEDLSTGTAFIQVAENGENCIVLSGGANQAIDEKYIRKVFRSTTKDDILLIQNEISCLDLIIRCASEQKMKIFFNPAPMTPDAAGFPLEKIHTLILNDSELESLKKYSVRPPSNVNLLLTHGAEGASYFPADGSAPVHIPAFPAEKVVDTTAAGDTFIGYFIAGLLQKAEPLYALRYAAKASSICVSRAGAAPSIPFAKEIK